MVRVESSPARWPNLVELDADPRDVAPPWAEHVQGISYGNECWFITQADRVWRIPMTLDLSGADVERTGVLTASIPEDGIDHLGDCDFHDGVLYVAMEGTDPPRLGIFDLDLAFLGSVAIARQAASDTSTANPWCAVNPRDGLLYSSQFRTDRIHAYRLPSPHDSELEHTRDIPLLDERGHSLDVERVQGGAFTSRGLLYLTSDIRDGGIMGFDAGTGQRQFHRPIAFTGDAPEQEVIEGVTAIDLTDRRVPWMNGVLHVLMFDESRAKPDYVWLRHFDVADERDRGCF
jgi:hypothetical protein